MPPNPRPRTLLAHLLLRRRWTVEQFCAAFVKAGAKLDPPVHALAERTAKRWLAGEVGRPNQPAPDILEGMFGVSVDRLLAPADLPPAAPQLAPSAYPASTRTPATYSEVSEGHPPDPPAAAVGGLLMATEDAADFLRRAQGAAATADAVLIIRSEIGRIARAFPIEGGPALVPNLAAAQRFLFRHLDAPDPDHTQDLYFLAAATAGLLARAARDVGQLDAALTHTRTALLCADRAGYPALRLWIRNEQTSSARWAGWHHESLRYAQLAEADAVSVHGASAVQHAYLHARALAAVGKVTEARGALTAADAVRERRRDDELDQYGGQLAFSDADALYLAADAYSLLPDPVAAEQAAATAVEAFAATPTAEYGGHGNRIGSYQALALARARNGDPDGAREALQPILDLPTQHRVFGVFVDVQRIHEALTAPLYHGSTTAVQTAAELEAFTQDARPHAALP